MQLGPLPRYLSSLMPPALETRDLTKTFGSRIAVAHLAIQVEPGEIYGFLGPNGAGKTTAIRMMTGLVRPSSGDVWIHGQEVRAGFPSSLEGVGALVDSPAFYPYLTGTDNLGVLGRAFGTGGRSRIREVLDLVGLSPVSGDRVRTYSQGMRQRLGFALALLGGSRLLILDEPGSSLDPPGRDDLRGQLQDLSRRDGVTIFLSSHLLGEVEATCDRIGLLQGGRLVAEGKVAELLRPRTWRVGLAGGSAEEAQRIASETTWCREVKVVEGGIEVAVDRERAADLCALLVKKGTRVEEFAPVRPTLEEFFREHASR